MDLIMDRGMVPMRVRGKDQTMYLQDMDHMQVNREGSKGLDMDLRLVSHRHFRREVMRVRRDRNIQDNLKFQGIFFYFLPNSIP